MILDKLSLNGTDLTDANRPIRLRLCTANGMVNDLLLVKHVSGVETICGGIEYSLMCVSRRPGMELKQFIANSVELQFVTDSGGLRTVCGVIGGVAEGQSDGVHHALVSSMHRSNCWEKSNSIAVPKKFGMGAM